MEKAKLPIQSVTQLKGHQINWNQVFYFSEIAAAGSIKDAAIKLELSSSTLSAHLAQLEKDLQVQLFYRHHRKLELTSEGNRLFLHTKEMFESGRRLVDVVSPIALGSYPVSIGLVPSPSIHIAYRTIGDFLEKNPKLDLKLFHSGYAELEEGLASAKHDFGFSDRTPDRKDLCWSKISHSAIKFYVASKWEQIPFSEILSQLPLLICNAEPQNRSLSEQTLLDANLSHSSIVTSDFPGALVDLCKRGLGIGVFSEVAVKHTIVDELRSLRVPPDAPKLSDSLYVLWAKDAENTVSVKLLKSMIPKERGSGTA